MGAITGAFIYAMSLDGEFFAADYSAEYKKGGVFDMKEFKVGVNNTRNVVAHLEGRNATPRTLEGFHHSSFLAGNEVACAGEIYVENGNLIKIDNNSGHYAPAPVAVLTVADSLCRNAVNVDAVNFGYNTGNGNRFSPVKYYYGRTAYLAAKSQWPNPKPK